MRLFHLSNAYLALLFLAVAVDPCSCAEDFSANRRSGALYAPVTHPEQHPHRRRTDQGSPEHVHG